MARRRRPTRPSTTALPSSSCALARPNCSGSFRIRKTPKIDAVQESDGADVISTGLPGFEQGLFITQDGYNDDILSGDPEASNFKYVPWERIARSFDPPLQIAPGAWNPRRP